MPNHLIELLRRPESVAGYTLADWDLLLRQARQALLLGHVAALLDGQGVIPQLPERVRTHFESAMIAASRQHRALRAEVTLIATTLADCEIPVILLKGAAYVLAGLKPSPGRIMSDIDLLFAKDNLKQVSMGMFLLGFVTEPIDEYDRKYYLEWSHELPPVQHLVRKTTLDLHHHIIPPTCRLKPDIKLLLRTKEPIAGRPNVYTLAPVDMVLHSATHLFHDGELDHGLRDIVDLHNLLMEFGNLDPDFFPKLVTRARELDLILPLAYALRYTQRLLETPVPSEAIAQTEPVLGGRRPLMDFLFTRAFAPPHSSCDDWATSAARWLLYVRSHYLRMPMHLLIPHLARKALRRTPLAQTNVREYRQDCADLPGVLARKAEREKGTKRRE